MKKFSKVLVIVFAVTMLFAQYVAPVSVQAAPGPLVYEGFNYSPQPMHGLNGGVGFSSAFEVQNLGGSRLGLCISDNSPQIYSTSGKYLTTSGNDLSPGNAYLGSGRALDMSSIGALKDYIVYNPTPVPPATPVAANGIVGKAGTKLWVSYLHNFGMPGGVDGDNRAVTLSTGATVSTSLTASNQKVSIGYFGPFSRLGVSTTPYWTLRVYSASNPDPIVYPTIIPTAGPTVYPSSDKFYDQTNKFLYVRMIDKPIPLIAQSNFVAYSIDYTASDSTIKVYINPELGAVEPVSPTLTFTLPASLNNMNFRSLYFLSPNGLNKMYFDELRMGSSYETVNPYGVSEPQPIPSPNLGAKITWGTGTASPQPGTVVTSNSAANGQYLVDGILSDNAKVATFNNAQIGAYYTVSLPSTMMVAGAKLYLGEAGSTLGKQTPLNFYLTYYNGNSWDIIPGTNVWSNRATERTFAFSKPVYTNKIRLVNSTMSDTKIRELELFEPAANASFSQTVYNLGALAWADNFGYLDLSYWDIVGATPSSLETPPPWTSPNPYPSPIYAPQIVDDSAVAPLDWMKLSLVTPIPTTAPAYRSDYYTQDGKALLLTAATNYYAFRSKNTIPSNYIIDTTFKCGRSGGPVSLYFNENGTTATGTATNGYRLNVSNNDSGTTFYVELKKVVAGTEYFLTSGVANVRNYYYETLRIQVKDGNIKVYQYEIDSGFLQLIDINDSTFTTGSILLPRQGNAFPRNVAFDSVKVYNISETSTDYSPHNVTFKNWDNSVLKTEEVAYSKSATAPTTPPRTGYTFTAWDIAFSNVITDLTVTATYSINHYNVNFKDWNGNILKTESVAYLGSATAPTSPTRVGHTFTSWDVAYSSITADLNVTAVYSINSYLVQFYNWDDSPIGTPQPVNYGSGAVAPTNPTRLHYTFKGWDVLFDNIVGDLGVKATFAINTFTVTFKNDDGSIIGTPQTIDYGSAATAPNSPTRTGYKFKNWSLPFNFVSDNMTITAVYDINVYTVTFKNWDGSTIGALQSIDYGASAVAPANPTHLGFTFTGWSVAFDKITSDLTVDAVFSANPIPPIPTITQLTNTMKALTGKAAVGGVVTVMVGTKKYTVNSTSGAWKITLSTVVKAGTKITAYVVRDGVKSPNKSIFVIPATPSIISVKTNAILIKGIATKASVVYIKVGSKIYIVKASSKTGSYSVKVPKLKRNTTISVKCKAGGQYSASKILKVK